MLNTIRQVWKGAINEDVLLGGGAVKLSIEQWKAVISAVTNYVLQTKRKI